MKIVIVMEGGLIQNIISEEAGLDVTVIDYDAEGADESEISIIGGNEAIVSQRDVEVNAKEIEDLEKEIQNQ